MTRLFKLETVREIIPEVSQWLASVCTRFEIAGSVRREKGIVHDIDIVVIPKRVETQRSLLGKGEDKSLLDGLLADLAFKELIHIKANGAKIKRFVHCESGVPVDIYVARDMDEWWPLLVIRTGSVGFNKKLCMHAKKKLWKLYADGRGLETVTGEFVEFNSEKGFFSTMGIKYIPPRERTDVVVLQMR